jgi:SOS regulatory protein LexA
MTKQYFEKIRGFYGSSKRMPTYSEIMKLTGLKSKNAVYKLVNKMVDAGIVEKDKSGRLLPTGIFSELKFLGLVEAGWPSPAEEELLDTISIDDYLIRNKEATYLLQAKGDSMKDAGIVEGDLVLAERGRDHKDGDIVIARVDGDFTMKYYRRQSGSIFLEPANRRYKPIMPRDSLEVIAVVIGALRKYKY